jgi:exopolysaccharide biosynthesis polyprenyl glycosylphosphotransferase
VETTDVDVTQQATADPSSEEAAPLRRARIPVPSLRLRVSERKLLLALVDLAIINLALILALVIRTDFAVSPRTLLLNSKWFVTLGVFWLLWASFFDLYDLARAATATYSVRSGVSAALATAVLYTLTPWLTPGLQSRLLIFLFGGMGMVGIAGWRLAYARLFVQPWFKQRALVVGAGWAGRTLVSALQHAPNGAPNPFRGTGYRIVGFVDDDPQYRGSCFEDVPVLGDSGALVELAEELEVDEVILAITHRHAIGQELFDALLRCRELGFRLVTMSKLYERLLWRVPVEHIGRDLPMVVPMEETWGERLYGVFKRLADVFMAAVGLVAVAALIPFIALVNLLTSRGPLFYRQERVGRGGQTFVMLKFRTMVPNAERDEGAVWACHGDRRVTPVGWLLRGTRLDELPQCWNVLRGHMSVIGPRPERPEFVEQLAAELPFYRARHAVRPGITGWAQVQFQYGKSVEDAKVKLEYDLFYVKHANPFLDLRILLKTLPVMIERRGY